MSHPMVTLYKRLKRWWLGMVDTVDHKGVLEQVVADGRLSYNYAFMIVIAAGIATIGLLLNSPAVIIGAMLVSPLMGPIVLGGISITTVDHQLAGYASRSLAVGILLALITAFLIVHLSPITDITPEILARTRPNLFDLVVAIFSGLAGGYGMIRGRGGAIVGVAIATALMPPIAVVGYGVASEQWTVARGAFFLFLTNMLAIGIAVAFVATWYGFGRRALRHEFAWQTFLALVVLVPLSIPLALSLRTIAHEAYVNQVARQLLEDQLKGQGQAHISSFQVSFPKDRVVAVEAVVVTDHVQEELQERSRRALENTLHEPVRMEVQQVQAGVVSKVLAQSSALANPVRPAVMAQAAVKPDMAALVRQSFPLRTRILEVQEPEKRISILPEPAQGVDIEGWHRMEQALMARFPGWQVTLVPPQQALDPLRFGTRADTLDQEGMRRLADVIWALKTWGVRAVQVTGHASTLGRGSQALAERRAQGVAEILARSGIDAEPRAAYPVADQRRLERNLGYDAFQSVEITPLPPANGK